MRMRIAVATATLGALLAFSGSDVQASSHREAPFITKNPKVDGTDFYMFNSYETGKGAFVTLIANYLPLQDAYGGPNYFTMDSDALYEIHVDNTGDAVEDLTFQFQFKNPLNDATGDLGVQLDIVGDDAGTKKNSVPVVNLNFGANLTQANQATNTNVNESYTVKLVNGPRRGSAPVDVTCAAGATGCATGDKTFRKPIDYVGKKVFGGASTSAATGLANYNTYANAHIYPLTIPGCATAGSKVFVGQRAEGFAANIGTIFDLLDAPLGVLVDANTRNAAPNPLLYKNVTSIALEIPAACLTKSPGTVIGAWTTASVRQARVINPTPKYSTVSKEGGAWAQVSRLGNPLVNEVVVGMKDKDKFNTSEPKDDAANYLDYVTHSVLMTYISAVFGAANVPPIPYTRSDLVTIFLTGVAGVNQFPAGFKASEMLRLNTGVPATVGTQTNLGAAACFSHATCTNETTCFTPIANGTAGCDYAGFPNGRRPGDDVVDIALTAVLGYFLPTAKAPQGGTVLHDAVLQDASQFPNKVFPYLNAPNPGS